MNNIFLAIGSIYGFLGVAIGAFGAHALSDKLKETGYKPQFETGVLYHFIHALALILAAKVFSPDQASLMKVTGISFSVGILLFSGSLYIIGITGQKSLGMITPIGGTAFLVGWATMAYSFFKG